MSLGTPILCSRVWEEGDLLGVVASVMPGLVVGMLHVVPLVAHAPVSLVIQKCDFVYFTSKS